MEAVVDVRILDQVIDAGSWVRNDAIHRCPWRTWPTRIFWVNRQIFLMHSSSVVDRDFFRQLCVTGSSPLGICVGCWVWSAFAIAGSERVTCHNIYHTLSNTFVHIPSQSSPSPPLAPPPFPSPTRNYMSVTSVPSVWCHLLLLPFSFRSPLLPLYIPLPSRFPILSHSPLIPSHYKYVTSVPPEWCRRFLWSWPMLPQGHRGGRIASPGRRCPTPTSGSGMFHRRPTPDVPKSCRWPWPWNERDSVGVGTSTATQFPESAFILDHWPKKALETLTLEPLNPWVPDPWPFEPTAFDPWNCEASTLELYLPYKW